jgi:flavodoxin
LVVYYSETKNTEKVAKAIFDEVSKEHEAFLKKADEINADSLNNYDLVFLGSACHGGDLAPPVKTLLRAIPESPKFKLAGFFTHSCPTQEHSSESFDAWASKCVTSFEEVSKEKKIDFRGYFNCQGAPSPRIHMQRTI